MVRIQNLNGTSKDRYAKSTNYKNIKKPTGKCRATGCDDVDLVRGHVKKTESNDNDWYTLPICRKHNNFTDPYDVDGRSLTKLT